jgi:adenylate cyclase
VACKSESLPLGIAVNIASRVERANKKARTQLLVSEAVLREVQDKVRVGKSIHVRLTGKTGKYALHEVLGVRKPIRRKRESLIRVQ